jgi:hypothetical protein
MPSRASRAKDQRHTDDLWTRAPDWWNSTFCQLKNFPGHVHCKCCTVTLPQFFIPKFENLPKKKYLALYAEIFNPNISPADWITVWALRAPGILPPCPPPRRPCKDQRKVLNLESLKCHFLDFGEDLTEFGWSDNSILVCRNLQFSSTKWAKAYLINYINIG